MSGIYIGIDPGKSGAFAVIDGPNREAFAWGDTEFAAFMAQYSDAARARRAYIVAAVEKVGAMPGQGVTSMFNFGKSAGFIEGVLTAVGIPFQLVTPRKWKTDFGLDSDKAKSIAVCKQLFPGVNLLATPRCFRESDGMAEALLIAEYARRHF